jgi:hypothetical protein
MKTTLKFSIIFLIAEILTAVPVKTFSQSQDAVSIEVFYKALSPYGKWLYDKTHGYVWTPNVDSKFRPYYTNGYWAMTEHGCTWVSNYAWGWAPFHYGRWVYDSFYRWVWVPGSQWASAWVVWRSNGDFYGWVPITPGTETSAAMGTSYYVPNDWWVFIRHKYLLSRDFQSRVEPARNNTDNLKKTSSNSNVRTGDTYESRYPSGPEAGAFARATGQQITVYGIKKLDKPAKTTVTGNEMSLYMPPVEKWQKGNQPEPAKYTNAATSVGKIAALSTHGGASPVKSSTAKKPASKSKTKSTATKKPAPAVK